MNKVLISILIILFANSIYSQSKCLDNIKKGKFELVSTRNDGYYLIRRKKRQIEVFNNKKSRVISRIEWVSNNEYYLTVVKEVNVPKNWKSVLGKRIYVKITECDSESYTSWSSAEGMTTAILNYRKI